MSVLTVLTSEALQLRNRKIYPSCGGIRFPVRVFQQAQTGLLSDRGSLLLKVAAAMLPQSLHAVIAYGLIFIHLLPALASYHNGLHFQQRQQYPEQHPGQISDNALGLPESCLTYTERYAWAKNYTVRRGNSWNPNALNPKSKFVVLLRIHYGLKFPRDLLLSFRTLMEEVSEVGMHIWLLYEDSPLGDPSPDNTPYKFMSKVPEELLPITFMFSSIDVHNMYPKAHVFQPHYREYLPAVYFMHRNPHYRFSWVLEFDVRYTGAHWGRFFNSALHLGSSLLSADKLEPEQQRLAGADYNLPADDQPIPDFLLFGEYVFRSPVVREGELRWFPRDFTNWKYETMTVWSAMEMGLSRRMMDKLHELSLEGWAGYLEEWLPSVAYEEDLDFVSVPVAEYGGQSNHCCTSTARELYRQWYRTGQCQAATLLHPIKLWPGDVGPGGGATGAIGRRETGSTHAAGW